MAAELNAIDQKEMRALIKERLLHPELYADKPLFIWQAGYDDSIQQELVIKTCLDFNNGKTQEEWSYFRLITVREGENHLSDPDRNSKGHLAGYVITTRTLSLQHYLREVGKLIEENKGALPIIVYLPYRYEQGVRVETCFNAEQLIFSPDFEQWAETWSDNTIPDFIRGNGDKADITYRWYNRFNAPDKGCSTPRVWLAVNSFLKGFIKLTKNYKQNYGIADLGEDLIHSAFQAGINASGGHISDDVITDFLKHVKSIKSQVSSNTENTNDNRDK